MVGNSKLVALKDKWNIGTGYGEVIDGKTLTRLYQERQVADLKRAEKKWSKQSKVALPKSALRTPARSSSAKKVTIQSAIRVESSDDELEVWDTDASASSSSASTLPAITVSNPPPRPPTAYDPPYPPFTCHSALSEVFHSFSFTSIHSALSYNKNPVQMYLGKN